MTTTDHRTRAAKAEATAAEARDAALAADRARWQEAVEAQPTADAQTVADYPDADRRLREQERTARREFADAIVESPFGAAWIRARAAHYRRQTLADDARAAADRIGQRGPGQVAFRDPQFGEDVAEELDRAARLASLDQIEEVASKPVPGPDPVLLDRLRHLDGCPAERVEAMKYGVRCMNCAASVVVPPPVEELPRPDSEAFRRLWKLQPSKIAEQLDPAQRADPRQNPQHPQAESEPPAYYGGRPTR